MKGIGTLPRVANTMTGLGARSPKDIEVDATTNLVVLNNMGMSARPRVKDIPLEFLPERIDPAGWGEKAHRVFKYGEGPFAPSAFAAGLSLHPDAPNHGVVIPVAAVTLDQYIADLVATRAGWEDIET